LISFALPPQAQAQQPSAALMQKSAQAAEIAVIADQRGHVRLIIEFASPVPANQVRPDPALLAPLRAQIAATQDAIIGTHFGSPSNPREGQGFPRALRRLDITPMFAVNVNRAEMEALAADPRVLRIYPDRLSSPTLIQTVPMIGMTGGGGAYALGATGQGQAVAILDTGVNAGHEFLSGKVVAEACFSNGGGGANRVSLCPNGTNTQTGAGAAEGTTAQCLNGSTNICTHGSHVAGIAAGKNTSQTTGEPTNGVARDGKIVAVQIFTRFNSAAECSPNPAPCMLTWDSDQIAGLNWVFQNINLPNSVKTAAVNMSLGGGLFSGTCDGQPQKAAIDNLKGAGVATVIASGNNGSVSQISSPGCISTAITVGSSTKSDGISSFSNISSVVDLMAPGSSILSSIPPNPTYAFFDGTSMATPHVAGAIAAIRTACPTKTVDQIEAALKSTGTPIVDNRAGGTQTKPRIRVDLAVQQLACAAPPPVACTISYAPSTLVAGQSLTVTWTATGSPTARSYTLYNSSNAVIFTSGNIAVSGSVFIPEMNELPPGTYTRIDTVSNSGSNGTCSATLTILPTAYACTISYTPSTVVPGQSLTVTWTASGGPTARSYKLYNSSNAVIFTSGNIAVSGSVFIPAMNDLPPGTYRREDLVSGSAGGGTCSATLTVLPAAYSCTISYDPSTVVTGQSLTVTWTASSGPTGRSYKLYNSSNAVIFTSGNIALSGSVFIPAMNDLPPGAYRREDTVSGPSGGGACQATLTVVASS
jgi:subtilisin family serine protease